jgi:hypothetical protein
VGGRQVLYREKNKCVFLLFPAPHSYDAEVEEGRKAVRMKGKRE